MSSLHRILPALALYALLAISLPLDAGEVYRTVDKDGNVTFTDQPPTEDAEPVALDPIHIYEAPRIRLSPPAADTDQNEGPVIVVRVVEPANEETVRNNAGNVLVRVETENQPSASLVRLRINGATRGTPNPDGIFALTALDRGENQVVAEVVDAEDNVLATSATSVFYLQRFSNRFRPAPN